MVTSEDIVLAISSSGETEEVVGLVPYLKRFNVSLIALTGNPRSTLARQADAHIDVSVREEACSLGIVPTASTTAALAMGDAIAVTMLVKRGFSREDFASFHPGGAIGKKLLVKVSDLMHKGDDLPLVAPETSISDALLMMSSKRLGMTIVAGKDGRVEGVITDGDVRRGIEKWGGGFFGMASSEVMSLHPKTVDQDELAAKALATMEEHSITTLVVPDGDGRPVGVIHVHDILKKGIA